jgi:hypothetical protein
MVTGWPVTDDATLVVMVVDVGTVPVAASATGPRLELTTRAASTAPQTSVADLARAGDRGADLVATEPFWSSALDTTALVARWLHGQIPIRRSALRLWVLGNVRVSRCRHRLLTCHEAL